MVNAVTIEYVTQIKYILVRNNLINEYKYTYANIYHDGKLKYHDLSGTPEFVRTLIMKHNK